MGNESLEDKKKEYRKKRAMLMRFNTFRRPALGKAAVTRRREQDRRETAEMKALYEACTTLEERQREAAYYAAVLAATPEIDAQGRAVIDPAAETQLKSAITAHFTTQAEREDAIARHQRVIDEFTSAATKQKAPKPKKSSEDMSLLCVTLPFLLS